MSRRPLLTPEQFAELRHAGKAELLRVLSGYVQRPGGRPTKEKTLSGAERARRFRERQRAERLGLPDPYANESRAVSSSPVAVAGVKGKGGTAARRSVKGSTRKGKR